MFAWYRRRWLELVASIYLYNEHRGYTALDRVLAAVRSRWPGDHAFIAEIEQHRADEEKHYQMFKRWWQKRGVMPIAVDRTCGHIDRFVEIMFRTAIDDLDDAAMVATDERFAKLCRVIALTERRGFWQVEVLLRHPAIRADRQLMKILRHHQGGRAAALGPVRSLAQTSPPARAQVVGAVDRQLHPFGAAGAQAADPVPHPAAPAPDGLARRPRPGPGREPHPSGRACLTHAAFSRTALAAPPRAA